MTRRTKPKKTRWARIFLVWAIALTITVGVTGPDDLPATLAANASVLALYDWRDDVITAISSQEKPQRIEPAAGKKERRRQGGQRR